MAALAAAKHEHELAPDRRVHVHLDAEHMGLGGDDSWSPSVLEVGFAPAATCRCGLCNLLCMPLQYSKAFACMNGTDPSLMPPPHPIRCSIGCCSRTCVMYCWTVWRRHN